MHAHLPYELVEDDVVAAISTGTGAAGAAAAAHHVHREDGRPDRFEGAPRFGERFRACMTRWTKKKAEVNDGGDHCAEFLPWLGLPDALSCYSIVAMRPLQLEPEFHAAYSQPYRWA